MYFHGSRRSSFRLGTDLFKCFRVTRMFCCPCKPIHLHQIIPCNFPQKGNSLLFSLLTAHIFPMIHEMFSLFGIFYLKVKIINKDFDFSCCFIFDFVDRNFPFKECVDFFIERDKLQINIESIHRQVYK